MYANTRKFQPVHRITVIRWAGGPVVHRHWCISTLELERLFRIVVGLADLALLLLLDLVFLLSG